MSNEIEGPLRVELLAASLRMNAADIGVFLEMLANNLSKSLPDRTVVTRHFSLFAGDRPVKEVKISLGEYQYRLLKERRGPLMAFRSKVVRGITLKTDQLSLDHWIDDLAASLAQTAAENAQARAALERFLL